MGGPEAVLKAADEAARKEGGQWCPELCDLLPNAGTEAERDGQ